MQAFLNKVRWANSAFLISTFITTFTAAPLWIWHHGIDTFQVVLFFFFLISTGISITLGYHRLFSHLTFQTVWPVKLYVLLFGAAAFEGSALGWCADHRRHHKFVDHDEDPYDISKGFFHAHIGWLLFRRGADTPLTWVRDLQKDKLAWWQHQYYIPIAFGMGFGVPALIGWLYGGTTAAMGAFLLAGVARVVVVHHMTFCINSLCHWIGDRPYSTNCSARDSLLMAFFTFGEGYHNFHHEFQHDYRNGVKPWQFDPTKWTIWILSKLGMATNLRTVPEERIIKAQIEEQERQFKARLESAPLTTAFHAAVEETRLRMQECLLEWELRLTEYRRALSKRSEISRSELLALKRDAEKAAVELRLALRTWMEAHSAMPQAAC